jgi:hypothetical protein
MNRKDRKYKKYKKHKKYKGSQNFTSVKKFFRA